MFKLTLVCLAVALLTVEGFRRQEVEEEDYFKIPARFLKRFLIKRSCVALGGTGCEGSNAKCCRKGNPYTGEMRKCINAGSFSGPVYKCVEA